MIKLKAKRVDRANDNTPILYDYEIDEFAHAVLADYKPQLLREPGAIDFEHFLESYLGVKLIYKDIYNDDHSRPILGLVAFRDCTVKVYDRENECASHMIVRAKTVIIDNHVMSEGRGGFVMFTGVHEGSHTLMHSEVYTRRGMICCRRANVESRRERTAEEWREHQADYCTAALTMPNATFKPYVNKLMREYGIYKGRIVLGTEDDLYIVAKELLPERLNEAYGISKQAGYIKLKKTGYVIERELTQI